MAAHRKLKKILLVVFGSFFFLFLLTWPDLPVPFVAPVFEAARPFRELQVEEVDAESLEPARPSARSSPAKKIFQAKEDIDPRTKERRERIAETCRRYDLGKHKRRPGPADPTRDAPFPPFSVFFFYPKMPLTYCPIYKAASTSWLWFMCRLAGVSDATLRSGQMSEVARTIFPHLTVPGEAQKLMEESWSVMIVRHPFERILSAYRDKLENNSIGREHGTLFYYERFGKNIVKRFRRENVTHPEPTFAEFVEYLTRTDLILHSDQHWIPYYIQCTPCLLDFTFVIKLETFQEDVARFLRKTGLDSEDIPKKHVTSTGLTGDVAREYFSTLSRDFVLRLYETYRIDFEMFGYSVQPYLQLFPAQTPS